MLLSLMFFSLFSDKNFSYNLRERDVKFVGGWSHSGQFIHPTKYLAILNVCFCCLCREY